MGCNVEEQGQKEALPPPAAFGRGFATAIGTLAKTRHIIIFSQSAEGAP